MTTVKINFDKSGSSAITGWNSLYGGTASNVALNDDQGSSSGLTLTKTGGTTSDFNNAGYADTAVDGIPVAVWDSFWFFSDAVADPVFTISGFSANEAVTLKIAGFKGNQAWSTTFDVNGAQQTYVCPGGAIPQTPPTPLTFNTTANGSGQIVVTATELSSYGYITFITLEYGATLAIDSTPSEINPETSFSIQVSGPATAPTTGNTTGNFTGLTGIAPDSVTGSDPYTITWTLPRTTAKLFDATGYVFDITIDAETASTSAIPYEPPTGSDYITVGTIDTGAQVYTDYTGGTFVSTDQLVWDNSPSLSFTDDLNYVVTGTLSATVYRIAAAGTVDVENTITFSLSDDGIVSAVIKPIISNVISSVVN